MAFKKDPFVELSKISIMKNYLIAILISTIPLFAFGQTNAIQKFYNKYKNYENVTDVKMQGWVLKLASNYTEEESASKLLQKITHLRVMVMEEGNLVTKQEYNQLIKSVKGSQFEELIKIKEGNQQIEFLVRQDGETITDVLIMVNGNDEFVLLSLEGNLKFSDLNDLNFEVDGAEHFKKLPEKKKDLPRA